MIRRPAPSALASRRALLLGAATAAMTGTLRAAADEAAAAVPLPELQGWLDGLAPQGRMRFRWFGLHLYDARLWSRGGVTATDYAERPFALELVYARSFEGRAIAERSLDEIERQGALASPQRARWLAAMHTAFPDVRPGDRLTGRHLPNRGSAFFHNGRPTHEVADAEFGRRFFGIWLAASSAQPALRDALLGVSQ